MTIHIRMHTYVVVFVTLLGLTGVTLIAAFVHMGIWNDVVALSIAVTKALLVMLYFMHLRHSPALTRICVAAGVIWLVTLITLTMSDVISRGWLTAGG